MVKSVMRFIRFWFDWNVVNEMIIKINGVSSVKWMFVSCVICFESRMYIIVFIIFVSVSSYMIE